MAKSKRKLSSTRLPIQQHLPFAHEGRFFDLKAIFTKINARFFGNSLKGYTITWGRRRRLAPKRYFVFGTIHEDDRIIRIHPRLDANFVPQWFLEYVVYHEMLHAVVPEESGPNGRRSIHTPEFLRREQAYPLYKRARRWETENLSRFLR
jgi:hypothetical protein